jgi:hypothetical protein
MGLEGLDPRWKRYHTPVRAILLCVLLAYLQARPPGRANVGGGLASEQGYRAFLDRVNDDIQADLAMLRRMEVEFHEGRDWAQLTACTRAIRALEEYSVANRLQRARPVRQPSPESLRQLEDELLKGTRFERR